MQVTFYHFSKRENSTKRPDSGTDYDCILKSPSSIISPVITLQIGLVSDPSYFNYCYIPDFDRYYWVQEWSWSRACWTAALKCDALATWRGNIGNTSLYVLRSSAAWDGNIADTMYPSSAQPVIYDDAGTYLWNAGSVQEPQLGSGHFVLTIAGEGIDNVYSISSFAIRSFLTDLSENYVSEDNGFKESDASLSLQKAMVDPFNYIKSCVFLPFIPTGTDITTINVGGIDFTVVAKRPNRIQTLNTVSWTLRRHPQTAERGKFVNITNTEYRLSFPPFGVVTLNNELAYNYQYCNCIVTVDTQTGNGRLQVGYSQDQTTIQALDCVIDTPVGVPVQLSQIYIDYYAAVNNAIRTSGGIASGLMTGVATGNFGGLITSFTNGIADSRDIKRPKLETVGSPSAWNSLKGAPILFTECSILVDDDLSHFGRPLCKVRTPASLGGYMLIQDGDVPIPGTAEEAREIRQYLEGGFYYE